MGILDRFRGARLLGETSALRDDRVSLGTVTGKYTLRTNKVNYELARKLYRNEHDDYKLGAWAAKPVVNTIAGFMGPPKFTHRLKDDNTQGVLDEGINDWRAHFLKTNRNASRDGDVFARIEIRPNRFDPDDVDFELRMIPPAWVLPPVYDTLTGELKEVVIKYPVVNRTRHGAEIRDNGTYHIIEIITPTERTLEVDGQAPAEVRALIAQRSETERAENEWGFIPIVHMKNDAEDDALYGMSDLEPIEPFMRAYHDAFLFSLQGAKTIARPKTAFHLKDVKGFLERNFTAEEIRTGQLSFQNKELFMLQRDQTGVDSVEFIVADTGLQGTATLLEFLFYCIVDVSQTPEFAFGTAVASSKASVSEQMPVLARNIERKRGEAADYYAELASMYLAMQAQVGMPKPETFRVDTEWDEVSPKDDADIAATLVQVVDAMISAVDGGLMSIDAAVDYLREFCPTMLPYATEGGEEDERARIISTQTFRQQLESQGVTVDQPAPPPGLRPIAGGNAS